MENTKEIREEVITELIIDMLYRSLELRENEVKFDKFSLDDNNITFLLKKLNSEKYEAIENMLRRGE